MCNSNVINNDLLNDLCTEFDIKIPDEFINCRIYKEIAVFKDAEYIYDIAYEMLIRTNKFNDLMKEYDNFIRELSNGSKEEEFVKLNKLIERMNALGLKKTSFLGFDSDSDYDDVFKKIKQYKEVSISPWSVRTIPKFQLDSSLGFNSIYHMIIDFYNSKNELYSDYYGEYKNISYNQKDRNINQLSIYEIYEKINYISIPCVTKIDSEYKLLKDFVDLKELDSELLEILKEAKNQDLLIQTKSECTYQNVEFWYKYAINDIHDGLDKLIDFYIDMEEIYNKEGNLIDTSSLNVKKTILDNISDLYIPCVNRRYLLEINEWEKGCVKFEDFVDYLKKDGHTVISINNSTRTTQEINSIMLVKINKQLPCYIIENVFLSTLEYENLKNKYIETEALFSRPRLMFDEARLINIPINLNLSKEDLLLYIAQIKDDYDRTKNIVKNDIEYFFNLTLESDKLRTPRAINNVGTQAKTKRLLPSKRKDFKKSLAAAFYIYDLYKFFLPLFEQKKFKLQNELQSNIKKIKYQAKKHGNVIDQNQINNIKDTKRNERKNYGNNNLITQISYLVEDLSEEQVNYYLSAMKEFIHGVNAKGEKHKFKAKYKEEDKDRSPKYKNLIIGNSYILKSNVDDLINILGL